MVAPERMSELDRLYLDSALKRYRSLGIRSPQQLIALVTNDAKHNLKSPTPAQLRDYFVEKGLAEPPG